MSQDRVWETLGDMIWTEFVTASQLQCSGFDPQCPHTSCSILEPAALKSQPLLHYFGSERLLNDNNKDSYDKSSLETSLGQHTWLPTLIRTDRGGRRLLLLSQAAGVKPPPAMVDLNQTYPNLP